MFFYVHLDVIKSGKNSESHVRKEIDRWVKLTSVLKVLVKNLVKKSFYKKKTINILTAFSFPIKAISKFSLTGFLTSALRALVNISLDNIWVYMLMS